MFCLFHTIYKDIFFINTCKYSALEKNNNRTKLSNLYCTNTKCRCTRAEQIYCEILI